MSDSRVQAHVVRLLEGLGYPLTSVRRTLVTVYVAAVIYCLLVLSTFPTYSAQLLGADIAYFDEAILALTANTYQTAGAVGLGLVCGYAIMTGIAVTAAVGRVRVAGSQNARRLSAVLPGLLASGCASCGAGLLGLVGLAGALATLPFDGNLLRLAGLLLAGWLSRPPR
ncbi:hypothetical protein [Halorientalis pallida]|uniref:hypothetical protein n=1 Tax=Halorientalis pallida TaxID=2479928 RepID=UPI001D10E721|nr:hypothetical protein [Halorientalis pallida]